MDPEGFNGWLETMITPLQKDDQLLRDIADAAGNALHVWWLGQSGFLLKQGGQYLLIDPYLSDALTLKYAASDKPHVRMTECCVAPERLDFVKLICSSHQHTDHFDEATLRPMAGPEVRLVVGGAVEADARKRLGEVNIELIAIEHAVTMKLNGWTLTGLAAAHNEIEHDQQGRCKFLSFIVRRGGFTIFHSGDTLRHEGQVPAIKPLECDLMLLPINGNKPERRVAGNLSGTEAAELAHDCGAKLVVPHHFEMFDFNTASPDEFVNACERLGQPCKVMRCGERLELQPHVPK